MAEITNSCDRGNKGIGVEICRQLLSAGMKVVLTARDENKGFEAVEKLEKKFSGSVVFHQLQVTDSTSIASLAEFIHSQFGKLDILVNNAAILGAVASDEAVRAWIESANGKGPKINWDGLLNQTYDLTAECIETNYYGAKRTTEALIPLLRLSDSPRIVNVSSSMGKLKHCQLLSFPLLLAPAAINHFFQTVRTSEWAKGILNDVENLSEERIDEVLNVFLEDFKEGSLEAKGWPLYFNAYILSKAAMNAYTRILAKKYPRFRINCVCPGYVKTDINYNTGLLTVEEGAETPVMAALLPDDGPSGVFFVRKEVSSFVD